MMSASAFNPRPALLFSGLLLFVLIAEYLAIQHPAFGTRSVLPAAVTFDLVVGIPLLFYFVIVRRYRLPAATVVGAVGGGLAVAYCLIPVGQQQYLGWASHGLIVLEVAAVVLAAINLRRLARAYAEASQRSADFIDNLNAAFAAVFGRSLAPLVSELSMFRYALLGWWAKPEVGHGQAAFSSHRESGFPALIVAFACLSLIETVGVHLLVSRWSAIAAVLLLVLDVYTLVFLLAHLRAVQLRPITLDGGCLTVRVGFVWRFEVAAGAIAEIEELGDTPEPDEQTLNLAKPLLTAPNVLLTFARPVTVSGMYGLRRVAPRVALYVDDRRAFVQQLRAILPVP